MNLKPEDIPSLSSFCEQAILLVAGAKPEHRLGLFIALRYDVLNRVYPHETFSAGEATLSFFPDTLAYITGATPIPETKPDDRPFKANYLDWCRTHRAECAT